MSNIKRTGCLLSTIAAAAVVISGGLLWRRGQRLPVAKERVNLLGVPVDPLTMPEALSRIEEFIKSGRPHHIFTADASGIMRTQEDPELQAIVQKADLITPDGAGALLASKFQGVKLPERVSGVDLVDRISALAAEKGYRIFLFGAAEGVAQAAAETLQQRYPGLTIAGTRNGFFSADDEPQIVKDIAATHPDVPFVALGIPKQEQFIRAHFAELGVPVMVGVGGSFDVISGRLQRAPEWMQRSGLEWLYRLSQEPKRLPRLAALPRFILAAWQNRKQK